MIYFNILAPILLIISGLPQTIKLLKTKKSDDISPATYVMTLFAVLILLCKSVVVNDSTLIASNAVSCLLLSINTSLIFWYRFVVSKK